MCGRFVSARPASELADVFAAEPIGEPLPFSYNVAPTAWVYTVAGARPGRRLGTMQWGLVPSWAASPSAGPRPINARMETLEEKPAFAEALARRRVIIPADGFFEWRTTADGKQPYFISARSRKPLALAGLWDRWTAPDGADLLTCAIVTTPANDLVAPLHDRMPALLPVDTWAAWLDPARTTPGAVLDLLRPAPAGVLEARAVSRLVNSVANDGPDLLAAPSGGGEVLPLENGV
ncbi:MAG: SOS response-associated peptidase [Actinomycetota bacterium]|nr:SOS response-associated peptidase [Actinomycetota bacterium]